jgi:hypothetical protein
MENTHLSLVSSDAVKKIQPTRIMQRSLEGSMTDSMYPRWLPLGGGYVILLFLFGLAIIVSITLLYSRSTAASGYTEVQFQASSGIEFVNAFTDDQQGTSGSGKTRDAASCSAQVLSRGLVIVSIQNGYPGYSCTFNATIYNHGSRPVCLRSLVMQAPPAFTATGLAGAQGLVLKPGQQDVQKFSVHVDQAAQSGVSYRFRIDEWFHPMAPGILESCGQ